MFCIINSKMKKHNIYGILSDTNIHLFYNKKYIHFRIFLEFFQAKIQNFSTAILKILYFPKFSRS